MFFCIQRNFEFVRTNENYMPWLRAEPVMYWMQLYTPQAPHLHLIGDVGLELEGILMELL